jgi:hypothetical protein
MEILNLFPNPIGVSYYPDIENLKDQVFSFMNELQDPINDETLVYNIFDKKGPTINKFYEFMKDSVNQYSKMIEANSEYDVDSSWIFINESIEPHHHGICPIVSTFYISASSKKLNSEIGNISFIDPRGGINLFMRKDTESSNIGGKGKFSPFIGKSYHSIIPETGMILIFPGYLTHYVNRNLTDKDRILIGANWERTVDLKKIDKSLPKVPKGTPVEHAIKSNYNNPFEKNVIFKKYLKSTKLI